MKLLEEIPTFPHREREILETRYGIDTAEAFYDNAIHDRDGLRKALEVGDAELDRLTQVVEAYLSPERIAMSRQPVVRRPRGLKVRRAQ